MVCRAHTCCEAFSFSLTLGALSTQGGESTGDAGSSSNRSVQVASAWVGRAEASPDFAKGGRLLERLAKPAPFKTEGCGTRARD
jgi:hypothetical protein